MKQILSLLLCFVLLQAETFALRGGPANSGSLTVTGYYSGIMTDITGAGNTGLFLIGATGAGASSGQFILFSFSTESSNAFEGLITGLSDTSRGGSGVFTGLFSGTAVVTTSSATQSVSGEMTCHAVPSIGQNLRLAGTAVSETLTVDTNAAAGTGAVITDSSGNTASTYNGTTVGPVINYTVSGWQTSAPSSGSAGLTLGAGQ